MAMRNSRILIVGLVALVYGAAFAGGSRDEAPLPAYETFPEALGFQYGQISGTGLSYQSWSGTTGFQLAVGGVYVPYTGEDTYMMIFPWAPTTLDYAIGAELQFRVFGEAFTNWLTGQLYLFTGLHHRGYIPINTVAEEYLDESDPDNSVWVASVRTTGVYTPVVGLGAGIGIEFILFNHFSIPIELGYAVKWSPTVQDLAAGITLNLEPQIGFRYRY